MELLERLFPAGRDDADVYRETGSGGQFDLCGNRRIGDCWRHGQQNAILIAE